VIKAMLKAIFLSILYFILMVSQVHCFEIDPFARFEETTGKFERNFFSPVHEKLTLLAVTRLDNSLTLGMEHEAFINALIQGVRWNDDPLRMAENRPYDFLIYFKDSCRKNKRKKIGPMWDFMYRSHCGDMQFLHSMASSDNERAKETKEKILMWIEFAYKVSTGIIPHNLYFRSAHKYLDEDTKGLFQKYVTNYGLTRSCWQPEDLFTLKCDRDFGEITCEKFHNKHSEEKVMNIALGSALHVIQDSFSDSHTSRLPHHENLCSKIKSRGSIDAFLIYTQQDKNKHSKADKMPTDISTIPAAIGLDGIDVCTQIIAFSLSDRRSGKNSWDTVRLYLEKSVFALDDENMLPHGGKYKRAK
jgi:hypothetical protein